MMNTFAARTVRYALLLAWCTAQAFASPNSNTPVASIPFELSSNHIFVRAQVNGSDAMNFIVDTGVSLTLIHEEKARAVGLVSTGTTKMASPSGVLETLIYQGLSISIPGVSFSNVLAVSYDLSSLPPHEGRHVDGILSFALFGPLIVEIDYEAKYLHLYQAEGFEYPALSKPVPIVIRQNNPFVMASVRTGKDAIVSGEFMIDTGANIAVGFSAPFIEANALLTHIRTVPSLPGSAVGGRVSSRLGRIGQFSLGDIQLNSVTAIFSEGSFGAGADQVPAGIIGGEVLRRFRVFLDYARARMNLEPTKAFNDQYEQDMSGMRVIADGPALNIFKVDAVLDGSAAQRAGIEEGDLIEAIDGKSTAAFTLSEIEALFRLHNRRYELAINRRGKRITVKLRIRRRV